MTGLEVKANVPEKQTGQLVEALTDMIRPFTETRGLKADQVRLQREDVLYEIAKKARFRADLEKVEISPIPTKTLVPLLEKASLENISDVTAQERWAALMVSASKNPQSQNLTFVDILSRLSSEELEILDEVCFSFQKFPELSYPGGHIENNKRVIVESAAQLILDDKKNKTAKEVYDAFVASPPIKNLQYARVMHATVKDGGVVYYFYTEYGKKRNSLEILQRERVVDQDKIEIDGIQVGYFNITHLGVKFVDSCSPKAKIKNS